MGVILDTLRLALGDGRPLSEGASAAMWTSVTRSMAMAFVDGTTSSVGNRLPGGILYTVNGFRTSVLHPRHLPTPVSETLAHSTFFATFLFISISSDYSISRATRPLLGKVESH